MLQHFGVAAPRLCTDVSPQIKDIDIREQPGIDGEMSLRAAWNLMRGVDIDTLCIVDGGGQLQGLITVADIADANMDLLDTGVLAAANTSCRNLLDTLQAELIVGDADARITRGRICIGTSPEIMEELVKPKKILKETSDVLSNDHQRTGSLVFLLRLYCAGDHKIYRAGRPDA